MFQGKSRNMQSALWYVLAFWIIYCIWPVTSLTISRCVNHLYIKNRVRNRHAITRPASKNKHAVSCYQVCAPTSQALWNSKLRLPADVIGASPWQWDEVRCKYFKSQLSLSNLEAVETHDISQPSLWGHFKITSWIIPLHILVGRKLCQFFANTWIRLQWNVSWTEWQPPWGKIKGKYVYMYIYTRYTTTYTTPRAEQWI